MKRVAAGAHLPTPWLFEPLAIFSYNRNNLKPNLTFRVSQLTMAPKQTVTYNDEESLALLRKLD